MVILSVVLPETYLANLITTPLVERPIATAWAAIDGNR